MKYIVSGVFVTALAVVCTSVQSLSAADVKSYIRARFDETIRTNHYDDATLIPVPKPYTVPSVSGMFSEMYYWDTYFTNLGLIHVGNVEQARNNIEDIAYFIDWIGFMPNGNRMYFLGRSQPPFFSRMVADVFAKTQDRAWLARMYVTACREHRFWQENRMSPSGLNRYGGTFPDDAARIQLGKDYCRRIGVVTLPDKATLVRYGECFVAYCESGWDCSSRFDGNAHEANWVCQNSLLYGLECDLSNFADILGKVDEREVWRGRAEARKRLMNELMWDEQCGMFCDYDFVRRTRLRLVSPATFYPLFLGLATSEQAARIRNLLVRVEFAHGIAGCESVGSRGLQWDFPNVWAPLQHIVIRGLMRYGFEDDARRIAGKYVDTVDGAFQTTGQLWEKYDAKSGQVAVSREYKTPPMIGWTAGVYLECLKAMRKDGVQ